MRAQTDIRLFKPNSLKQANDTKGIVVIYTRVNGALMATPGHASQEMNTRAKLSDLGIDHQSAIVLNDTGGGGARRSEAFHKLKGMIRAGRVGVLAAYDTTRLTRDTAMLWKLLNELSRHRGRFVSVAENIDTMSQSQEIHLAFYKLMHEFQRDQVSHRIRRGLAVRVRQGDNVTGRAPCGYSLKRVRRHAGPTVRGRFARRRLVIDKSDARIVRMIFRLADQGKSHWAIYTAMIFPPEVIDSYDCTAGRTENLQKNICTAWRNSGVFRPPPVDHLAPTTIAIRLRNCRLSGLRSLADLALSGAECA